MKSRIRENNPLEGTLLVASPRLGDGRFDHSVVLVLHHGEEGSMGIVLNRPIVLEGKDPFSRYLSSLKEGQQVFQGGPVGNSVIAILPNPEGGEPHSVAGTVFLMQKSAQLRSLLKKNPSRLMLFLGHATWTQGQLEQEIQSGIWHVLPAFPELLQLDRLQMWVEAIHRTGERFYGEVLGIRHFPADATWN